jgi:PAS domain S-box-containing protein
MDKRKKPDALITADKVLSFQNKAKENSTTGLNIFAVADIVAHKKEDDYFRHLAAIVESSDDAIISKSLDGIIKSWNKGGEKMFGYTAKQVIGKHISLIVPPEYTNEEKKILERIRNNEIVDHYETVRIKKDGKRFYVSLTVSPLKDREGTIIGISKIARDISFQKESEAALVHANKELAFQNGEKEKRAAELVIANHELAFQNEEKGKRAAELIIANRELAFQNEEKEKRATELVIANTELVFQNEEKEKRAAELVIANKELAFQNEEKEKRAAELIIANKELAFQNEEKEKRATELVIANKELAFQNEEKEKRAAELIIANKELAFQNEEKEKRATELVIANKELAFQNEEKEKRATELIIANKELVFQNEEKEKRAEELTIAYKELAFQNEEKEKQANELTIVNRDLEISGEQFREVNKELESFSYSVSHDLRAPLRAVHGYTKMLKENFETQLNSEANRLMNNIMGNAKKMGQLIDDLLNFSRIGRKELVMVNVPMESIVTNICSELKNEQGDRDIEFHIDKLLPAQADSITIRHVWQNLISNAIKYSGYKDKAIIEIGSDIQGNEIIYHIKDNGAGFDMRYADKLFGVFQRLHSDEEFEGTGVGLALVQRIIFKHGGRVWAEGQVDKGAIFFFTLNIIPS